MPSTLCKEMDYKIRTKKGELDSTGYMEIGPGRYSGSHWNEGFIFVWEDAFGFAEGIVQTHFPDDHFSMNDIPSDIAAKIADDWRHASEAIRTLSLPEASQLLNLQASFRSSMEEELGQDCESISGMLAELADWLRSFHRKSEWICILGM